MILLRKNVQKKILLIKNKKNQMTKYIALLRGINVGGKNIIKMADLKKELSVLGLQQVETYIQSGNVLFESEKKENVLQKEIEQMIHEKFGFQVPVVLRNLQEMNKIVAQCPYSEHEVETAKSQTDREVFYLIFFDEAPSEEELERFTNTKSSRESFQLIGKNMYLLLNDGVRFAKISVALQKTKNTHTIRNWKTVNKLMELANK